MGAGPVDQAVEGRPLPLPQRPAEFPEADRRSFEYLAESILAHVSPEELAARLERRGCRVTSASYSLGAATRLLATRGS